MSHAGSGWLDAQLREYVNKNRGAEDVIGNREKCRRGIRSLIPQGSGKPLRRRALGHRPAAAALATHGAAAFEDEDGDGGEGGDGVCPGDVKGGVEGESGERDGGEIGAGGGLDGVGGECVVGGSAREFALLPRQQRHDEQSGHGDGDSERAGLGLKLAGQGEDGSEGDDGGEKKEQDAGGRVDAAVVEAEAGSQGENDERGGEQFDKAVKAEGEQRGAMGSGGSPERDGALDEHPGEGEGLEEDERARSGCELAGRVVMGDSKPKNKKHCI